MSAAAAQDASGPRTVRIVLDGAPLGVRRGVPLSTALLAAGHRALGTHPLTGRPMGAWCGTGACFACAVTVDGAPGTRACLTAVRAGMSVRTGPDRRKDAR